MSKNQDCLCRKQNYYHNVLKKIFYPYLLLPFAFNFKTAASSSFFLEKFCIQDILFAIVINLKVNAKVNFVKVTVRSDNPS